MSVGVVVPDLHATEREHKYLPTLAQAQRALAELPAEASLVRYQAGAPVAYARTTYLDTEGLDFFRSGHGEDQRVPVRRLRLREYAASLTVAERPELTGVCYLEVKDRAGACRAKQRRRLTASHDDSQVAELAAEFADGPVAPRMTTWYRRQTYQLPGVRITCDFGTEYCAPVPLGSAPAVREVIAYGPPIVLEVKLSGAMPPWLVRAVAPLTEQLGFSKFSAGMQALLAVGRISA